MIIWSFAILKQALPQIRYNQPLCNQHRDSRWRSRRTTGDTLPPKNTNKPSLTPTMPLLKSHFSASKSTP